MLRILYGSDTFTVREALAALKRKLDTDGVLDTNTRTFGAVDTSPEEVMAACDTVPFLGAHRLVVLEGALRRGGRSRGRRSKSRDADDAEVSAGAWGVLAEYVDRMPETTELVLVDGDVSSSALLDSLKSKGEIQKFDKPVQKAVQGWVQKYAKDNGIQLAGGAANALAELVGNDTWSLANELAKLREYANGRPVTADDVRTMVTPAREIPPWDLLDPIADGKGASALKALRRMLEHRHTLAIATLIQGTYRQLAVAREMIDSGGSGREVGERLGLRQYPLEKLLERANRYTPEMIRAAYERMLQADSDIKNGVYDEELSLELMVTDLALAASARSRAA